MDENRNEQESGFGLFDFVAHAVGIGIGFAAGNAVGSRRERKKYEQRIKALERDVVYDTVDPRDW